MVLLRFLLPLKQRPRHFILPVRIEVFYFHFMAAVIRGL
jgi:hypothetical protein